MMVETIVNWAKKIMGLLPNRHHSIGGWDYPLVN